MRRSLGRRRLTPGDRRRRSRHPKSLCNFDLRHIPYPSPPIKEPPDGPENPDVPLREPDPAEPLKFEPGLPVVRGFCCVQGPANPAVFRAIALVLRKSHTVCIRGTGSNTGRAVNRLLGRN